MTRDYRTGVIMQWRKLGFDQIMARIHLRVFLCVLSASLLGGCLPGIKWSDDVPQSSLADAQSDTAPVTNRSFKSALFAPPGQASALTQGLHSLMGSNKGASQESALNQAPDQRSSAPFSFASLSPAIEAAAAPDAPIIPANQSLQSFYAALSALSSGQRRDSVTVLHLGDDHIADDGLTGDLRNHLQSRFGNAGRGLVMPGLFSMRGMKVERGGKWTLSNSAAGAPFWMRRPWLRIATSSESDSASPGHASR